MAVISPSLTVTVRFEAVRPERYIPPRNQTPLPYLSISKPSWIVKTESNVRKEEKKKPDPPCVVCKGTGRVDCHPCSGKEVEKKIGFERSFSYVHCNHLPIVKCPVDLGLKFKPRRTNYVHLAMLPKGEWPKWCRTCGGSGLSFCSRCLGTGEYRYKMGFHFMNRNADDARDHEKAKVQGNPGPQTAADLFLNGEQLNSTP